MATIAWRLRKMMTTLAADDAREEMWGEVWEMSVSRLPRAWLHSLARFNHARTNKPTQPC